MALIGSGVLALKQTVSIVMGASNNEANLQNHYDYLCAIHDGNDEAYNVEKDRCREQYIKPLKTLQQTPNPTGPVGFS